MMRQYPNCISWAWQTESRNSTGLGGSARFAFLGKTCNMNICSCSYYETSTLFLRICHLDCRHHRAADRRTAYAPSRRLEGHAHPVRDQFSADGLARPTSVPTL